MEQSILNRRTFLHISTMILGGGAAVEVVSGAAEAYVLPNQRVVYRHIEVITEKYPRARTYIPLVLEAVEKHQGVFYVDPVLFLGLIKRESNFGAALISPVGAAGPVQFMPGTAQDMGMRVYLPTPEHFDDARRMGGDAYRAKQRAIEYLKKAQWDEAIEWMKKSMEYQEQAKALYTRYTTELRAATEGKSDQELRSIDERFVDRIAVDRGVSHFAYLLRQRDGDAREALCAYNAGLGAVKRADGIPYIEETVEFQNRIVNFYKHWASRAS